MHIRLADTWYPEAMLENALIRERESGEMVVIWHFPNGDVNGTDVFSDTDADALRAWLDAHTDAGKKAVDKPKYGTGWAVLHTTEDTNDCSSIPLGNDREIEWRQGEHKPYLLTSSGDPLEGFNTALEAIRASGLLDDDTNERVKYEVEYRQREYARFISELETARQAFEKIEVRTTGLYEDGQLNVAAAIINIREIKQIANEAGNKVNAATIPF